MCVVEEDPLFESDSSILNQSNIYKQIHINETVFNILTLIKAENDRPMWETNAKQKCHF